MSTMPALIGSLHGLPVYRDSFAIDPVSDDSTTSKAVRRMTEHVHGCARDPELQAMAQRAAATWGRVGLSSPARRAAWAAWWAVRHALAFEHHEAQLLALLNEPGQQQLLLAPSLVVRMERPAGDCAIFTMLVCTLLECLGVPWQIVTVKVDPAAPDRWSHVYAAAICEDGTRIPLDASHGKYPGWEVPEARMYGYQAWDPAGSPCGGRPGMSGLHGYTRQGFGAAVPRVAARQMGRRRRGIGDDGDSYTVMDTSVPTVTTSTAGIDLSSITGLTDSNVTPSWLSSAGGLLSGSTGITAAAGSSASGDVTVSKELSSLLNSWTGIASKVIAPTTTVYNAQTGSYTTTPASSTTAATLATTLGSSSVTTLFLLAGLGIGLFALIKSASK